jgi:hypothetical protein
VAGIIQTAYPDAHHIGHTGQATEQGRPALWAESTAVQRGSVVSWRHINLHGEYDFSEARLQDSVGLSWPLTCPLRGGDKKPAPLDLPPANGSL